MWLRTEESPLYGVNEEKQVCNKDRILSQRGGRVRLNVGTRKDFPAYELWHRAIRRNEPYDRFSSMEKERKETFTTFRIGHHIGMIDNILWDMLHEDFNLGAPVISQVGSRYYHHTYDKKNQTYIRVHRLAYPDSTAIDHINGNGLDNRLENLRPCTIQQNTQNRRNISGVCFENFTKRWKAYIGVDGRQVTLGRYDTKEEALRVRDEAETRVFGEFKHIP